MGIETVNPGFIPDCSRCSFVPMKTRIELYEQAIKDLESAKLESVRAEINRAKHQLVGFTLFAITAVLTIAFLV